MPTSNLFMLRVSLGAFLWLTPVFSSAQQIFNASFDSICVCAIDRVYGWVTSDVYHSNPDTVLPFEPNRRYSMYDGYELHFAINSVHVNYDQGDTSAYGHSVKLFTKPDRVYPNGESFKGFLLNGEQFFTDSLGWIDFQKGGSPFPYRPYALTGRYKFEDSLSAVDDFARATVLLKSYNSTSQTIDTIGYADSGTLLNPTNTWTSFSIPITYTSQATPDSIVISFFSSTTGAAPTTVWLDDIDFDFTQSIDEFSYALDLLYPNPCSHTLRVDFSEPRHRPYRILNIQGAEIGSGIMRKEIDVSNLLPGMYLLQVQDESGKYASGRFMKQ